MPPCNTVRPLSDRCTGPPRPWLKCAALPRPPLAALAVLVALAVAGCGGDDDPKSAATTSTAPVGATSTQEYRAGVTRVLQAVGSAGTALGSEARSRSTPQQLAGDLERFQAKLMNAADQLDGLTPPRRVVAAHSGLVRVLREIADGVQPSIDEGRAGDRRAFRDAFRAFQSRLNGPLRSRLEAAGRQALAG